MSNSATRQKKPDDTPELTPRKLPGLAAFQRLLANPNRSLFKPDAILDLQRTIGNQAVRQLVSGDTAHTDEDANPKSEPDEDTSMPDEDG